ncbi:ABC transporter ATP-binding protein [Marinigracilibium pacificum]|uniref:ABC transporter ATP-binding protein n=1 Tax=Marinigracilibium pacificum TaxID=2729599 RepID=A0A848J8K5_9BACT|nr:ABC transporter ATP-binding protein [Marinigracilibium pacificum]NMM49392.1 ABC transporter ATP-binding protein [Marinigracilibium pacificum]
MSQYSFRDISKVYFGENLAAVRGASIDLNEGEVVGVIGPSGSGKSTLLKLIGGFIESDSGEFYQEGEKLPSVEDLLIPGFDGVKYLRQDFKLDPNDTVARRLKFALRHYNQEFIEERYAELIDLTQLRPYESKICKLLSGGQRQRLALAVAIAEFPELLLMDEPFSQLDRGNKLRLITALREYLRNNKITSVIVTHHPEELFGLADRIIVMKDGVFIESGTPENIYLSPKYKITAELFGPVNWMSDKNGVYKGSRWEDTFLKLEKSSNSKPALIKEKVFAGNSFLYTFELDGEEYHAFSEEAYELDSVIHVEFDLDKSLSVRK